MEFIKSVRNEHIAGCVLLFCSDFRRVSAIRTNKMYPVLTKNTTDGMEDRTDGQVDKVPVSMILTCQYCNMHSCSIWLWLCWALALAVAVLAMAMNGAVARLLSVLVVAPVTPVPVRC